MSTFQRRSAHFHSNSCLLWQTVLCRTGHAMGVTRLFSVKVSISGFVAFPLWTLVPLTAFIGLRTKSSKTSTHTHSLKFIQCNQDRILSPYSRWVRDNGPVCPYLLAGLSMSIRAFAFQGIFGWIIVGRPQLPSKLHTSDIVWNAVGEGLFF